MNAEDPSASRTTRSSPAHQQNGHEERSGSVSRTEERRGSTRQTHPEHLITGPACQAAKGSSSSILYTDCSGNDYDMGRGQVSKLNNCRDPASGHCGSGSGNINRVLQGQQEHFLGRVLHREPPCSKPSQNTSPDLDKSPRQSHQSPHSTMADISAHSRESLITVPHVGSLSGVTSPAMNPHQAASLSHAEQNGSTPPRLDDGTYSPFPGHSPRSQKAHKLRHHSDTDQNQGECSPESRPTLSRAERMAALERRMVANGLSAPGRSRTSPGKKRLKQAGVTHVGAVQMNDFSTTSGSESSESEAEPNRGNCSSPQMFDNPAEANSPIPRNKFSFGSLQLDEEADEDGCHTFSDDEGGQIFSC